MATAIGIAKQNIRKTDTRKERQARVVGVLLLMLSALVVAVFGLETTGDAI